MKFNYNKFNINLLILTFTVFYIIFSIANWKYRFYHDGALQSLLLYLKKDFYIPHERYSVYLYQTIPVILANFGMEIKLFFMLYSPLYSVLPLIGLVTSYLNYKKDYSLLFLFNLIGFSSWAFFWQVSESFHSISFIIWYFFLNSFISSRIKSYMLTTFFCVLLYFQYPLGVPILLWSKSLLCLLGQKTYKINLAIVFSGMILRFINMDDYEKFIAKTNFTNFDFFNFLNSMKFYTEHSLGYFKLCSLFLILGFILYKYFKNWKLVSFMFSSIICFLYIYLRKYYCISYLRIDMGVGIASFIIFIMLIFSDTNHRQKLWFSLFLFLSSFISLFNTLKIVKNRFQNIGEIQSLYSFDLIKVSHESDYFDQFHKKLGYTELDHLPFESIINSKLNRHNNLGLIAFWDAYKLDKNDYEGDIKLANYNDSLPRVAAKNMRFYAVLNDFISSGEKSIILK